MDPVPQPETPHWFLQYFQNCREHNPNDPKWLIGQTAAQHWLTYQQNQHDADKSDQLCSLIELLMPYRFAGSGFYALWIAIIQHLARLSPITQFPVWQAIFEPTNQGTHTIRFSVQAQTVIAYWRRHVDATTVSDGSVHTFVSLVVPYCVIASAYEWKEFVKSLDDWLTSVLPNNHFFESVIQASQQPTQS